MGSKIVAELKHKPNNPRNSEGSFVTLADGRIMYAYTRYYGRDWADHGTAEIRARYSCDGGKTWSRTDRLLVANEGRRNVMSASLLRLADGRIALFYARKNSWQDTHTYMRTSTDEAASWGKPVLCIPAPGYFVVNNDRIVQLKNGRLILPTSYHRARLEGTEMSPEGIDLRGIVLFYYSDDGGATWQESADWLALPVRSAMGLQEPGVVELKGGTLYGWCRTDTGRQWQFTSRDKGDTWTRPEPSRFRSPCSPLSMKRIPATGDLLAVWNDHSPRWKSARRRRKSSWDRTPLAVAISSDEGKTWRKTKLIEKDPARGFCYTAIHFTDDAVLLAYCCGGKGSAVLQDTLIRRITLDWLYAS